MRAVRALLAFLSTDFLVFFDFVVLLALLLLAEAAAVDFVSLEFCATTGPITIKIDSRTVMHRARTDAEVELRAMLIPSL